MSKKLLAAIAALLAVLAGGTFVLTAPDGDPKPAPATVTVPVDGLDAGKAPDATLVVPKAQVEQAADALSDHTGSRGEVPADTPADELADAQDAAAKIRETQPALPTAGATQGYAGCRTSFVRNQSSRRGVRPTLQVLHYTVSANRPGWSDVNAIVAYFNSSSAQASSHFVIDTEGHCAYIVPIEAKAWTQAGGNPFSVSYEIIDQGNESVYLQPAGMAKLRSVVREVARRTGIPLRRGAVSGCSPSRSGIVQHRDGGTCWGGHGDIGPFPFPAIAAQLVSGGTTATDRVTCRKLNWWRTNGRLGGRALENAVRRRRALEKRGVTCTARGPVKA